MHIDEMDGFRRNSRCQIPIDVTAATLRTTCFAKHHIMIAMCFSMVLTSSLTTAFAFCPSELGPRARSSTDVISHTINRKIGKIGDLYHSKHNHLLSALFSSGNDEITDAINRINSEDASEPNDDEDDGDEEDVIFQKLRRNSQKGPINPIQEHDKMMKENHDEATFNATTSNINGSSTSSNSEEYVFGSSFYRSLLSSYIDPDANVHDSHSEYYIDEQMYELLSREGKELEKFGPGITTAPLDPSSEEATIESDLAQKELALQKVVKQIGTPDKERWDKDKIEEAQKLKAEIDRMHIDDCGAVLLANLAFYEAFSARDPDWMEGVWWNSPSVVCVHPSHDPLVGAKAVLGSFKNMFSQEMLGKKSRVDGTKPAQNVFMSPANIRALSVRGTTASLVCDEEIFDKNPREYSGRIIVNKLLTTNVFRKIGGKWKLVHRHAGWHPETLAADAGLKAKPGFVPVKSEREKFNDKLTKHKFSANLEDKRMKIRKLAGQGTSMRPADNQPAPTSLNGLNANNVVGVPDEKVKQKKKKKSSDDDLFRMLGLSSGSSEDDDEDDDDEEKNTSSKSQQVSLSDLLSNNKGKTTTTGSGTPEDPFITRRIISIGPEQFNQLASEGETIDGDEDNDDDEENVVIDLREKSEEERKNILSQIFPDQVDSLLKTIGERENERMKVGDKMKSASPEILPVQPNKPKSFEPAPIIQPKQTESPTQKCINVIRKLSEKGQLSSKQKRALMTDIIASSARGETSMVEVAYGLLLSDDSEAGMEDFTDQCKVFASASMDGNSDFSV